MRKLIALIALTILIFAVAPPASASQTPSYISKRIQNAAPVGQGRMRYMFWDVYDATLYAPNGKIDANKPIALSLSYLRPLDGRSIADTSAEEIRRQGVSDEIKIAMWHEQMVRIFPSVDDKTVLTGLYIPGQGTSFFRNGLLIGAIKDEDFSRYFFNIWLGPQTREPALRRALTGA